MADNDSITVVGTVGFEPDYKVDGNGLPRVTLRIASDQWQKNRDSGAWEKTEPNWYSVVAFRYLATNVAASVHKGERVIVTGNLKLHEWVDDGVRRIKPEIVAGSVGHDLNWGTSSYTRPVKAAKWSLGDDEAATPTEASDLPMADESTDAERGGDNGEQPADDAEPALVDLPSDELAPVF